ncbi:MAG: hypothetical protein NT007_10480 [Candidatus Kapabacteria bacterium]|nr:hypothetical protein [Candidatus Kapabacteria bacterium]
MISSKRTYQFTDAELCMLTSNLVKTMMSDQTEFTARGVTATMVTEMEALGNAFEVFPSDAYYFADCQLAMEIKQTRRSSCTLKLKEIVVLAKIKWGVGSPQVKKFDTSFVLKESDLVFLSKCRLAVKTATDYLAELSSIGLTSGMIDDLLDETQLFEEALYANSTSNEQRELKTRERITKGNELYELVSSYCEIGKIIWDDVNDAKYRNYLISERIKRFHHE